MFRNRTRVWPFTILLLSLIGPVTRLHAELPDIASKWRNSLCFSYLPYLGGSPAMASPMPAGLVGLSALQSYYLLRPLPSLPEVQDLGASGGDVLGNLGLPSLTGFPTAGDLGKLLGAVPVRTMLVKPGHIIVRDPQLVKTLSDIFSSGSSDLSQSEGKMVLDVVTNSSGRPLRVEVREAHHRLLAFHLAHPNAKVSDLVEQAKELEWLINGHELGKPSELVPNKVPVHAVPMDQLGDVDVHISKKAATFKTLSNNWDLGSRTSVAMAAQATTGRVASPRVALFYLPVDGSAAVLRTQLRSVSAQGREYAQVILIPQKPPTPAQLQFLKESIAGDPRLNLYVAPLERDHQWPGDFYKDILRMRLQQLVAGQPPTLDPTRN